MFRCSGCHGTFQKPLLATVSSHGYPSVGKIKRAEVKHESSVECKHFLGYLKKRPKGTSIPDECLVCDKMVECLIH